MPQQKTYGKKSRAAFDPRTAFSSPEQPASEPVKHEKIKIKIQPTKVVKKAEVEEEYEDSTGARSTRKALGEKQVNSVVLPLEALNACKDIAPQKPKARRKKYGTEPCQKIDQDGKVKFGGRHTFFEEEQVATAETAELPGSIGPKTPEPRRSPRKTKKATSASRKQTEPREERPCSVELQQEAAKEAEEKQSLACPFTDHCSTLLSLSAHPLTDFETWSAQLSEHFTVTKIAEASFGEVYRLTLMEDIAEFQSTDESVFKVIPLKTPAQLLPLDKPKRNALLKKEEFRSEPSDVANEVKLLQRMSSIPGFTNFRDVRILQGRPPPAFIAAFQAWNTSQKSKNKDLSHFPNPTRPTSYAPSQLWAVIEMQDAGTDLERLLETQTCTSVFPIWDIFWQTVLSLAKGEESAEFEHRDLHLGNICVRDTSSPLQESREETTLQAIRSGRKLGFTPFETTVIDYTISRCNLSSPTEGIAYTDLSLPLHAALFEGDSTEEYQYDIYRYMRGALFFSDPFSFETLHPTTEDITATNRTWEQFHPQTNLVWLHLVLYKFLEQISWESEKRAPSKKKKGGEEWLLWKKAKELESVLLKVQEMLFPERICANGVTSARDLVGVAIGEGWLDVWDVLGDGVEESALVSQLGVLEI